MQKVARIVEADPASRKAVVLSACRGVTDALLTLIALAERQDPTLEDRIEELRLRHVGIARELLDQYGLRVLSIARWLVGHAAEFEKS